MPRLFQAGIVAAIVQLIATGLTTLVAFYILRSRSLEPVTLIGSAVCEARHEATAIYELLRWTYLFTGIGIALTNDEFVIVTASRIRQASRAMSPSRPEEATRALLFQLCVVIVGAIIAVLNEPPRLVLQCGQYLGCVCCPFIVWPASMSIVVASFGATAQASWKAL